MHSQKLYEDTFKSRVGKALSSPMAHICRFVQIWKPNELEFPSECAESDLNENGRLNALRQPKQATRVVRLSFVNPIFIFVKMWVI